MRRIAVVLCLTFAVATTARAERREVVLVVSAASPVVHLDSIEIRKLFLGLTVERNGRPLIAVRNVSDPALDEIFLQNVVAMSELAYEHRLLTTTMQSGRPRPPSMASRTALLEAVERDAYLVTFAWTEDVARNPRLRVVRVLWRE
jgi:hypothetical protein